MLAGKLTEGHHAGALRNFVTAEIRVHRRRARENDRIEGGNLLDTRLIHEIDARSRAIQRNPRYRASHREEPFPQVLSSTLGGGDKDRGQPIAERNELLELLQEPLGPGLERVEV